MTTPLDAPDAADTTATIAPSIPSEPTEPLGSQAPVSPEAADAAALAEAPAIESIPADEPATEVKARPSAREINDQIRYTAYTVYSRVGDLEGSVEDATRELAALVDELSTAGVQIRGFYDVSTMRADADLLIWWHAATAEELQAAARKLRRTVLGRTLVQSWSAMGLHRPAEFNKGHIPAFLAGMAAKEWVCVYPFVRSYEWYLLPETERRGMLVEHGMMGREYNQVLSNTVAAFALGDYEWLLALEADELHDIIDLMRHLRASEARMHVREEIPFFTGRRLDIPGVIEVLA
ncbi:chlorite dismutase [Nakamurella silvestris]|nr:chlorite dismutase [Nakamurella silvestris]